MGCLIIGIARTVEVILSDASILDTIVYGIVNIVGVLPNSIKAVESFVPVIDKLCYRMRQARPRLQCHLWCLFQTWWAYHARLLCLLSSFEMDSQIQCFQCHRHSWDILQFQDSLQ